MKRFALFLIGLALGIGMLRDGLFAFITEPGEYSIVEPHLTCAQATQLSKRVVERLGYALDHSEVNEEKDALISATRRGSVGSEKLVVKIVCGNDGVRVEAIPDISPCEQANQRAKQAMEQLQFTVTSFSPAAMGKRGVIKGTRERPEGEETTMATIHCNAEAVYIDASADSPLFTHPEFLKPISDIRRGFFALFKPMAAAVVKE